MGKRRKRSTGASGLLILVLLVVGAVAAGAYYLSVGLRSEMVAPKAKPIVTVTPRPVVPVPVGRSVKLYLPKESRKGMYLAPVTRTASSKGDILDAAMQLLLATNEEDGIYANLIPKDTKLLSPVRVKDGIAVVNLSKEFKDNFSGGSDQEALTLNSIVHTLVSNSEGKVKSVRILIEGEQAETLGGHFELTDPITADSTLLKPK